MKLSLGDA